MQTVFRGRHFINLEDFTKEEVDTMLEVSFDLKKKFAMGVPTNYLPNQSMFLMFFEQSTRTRNSMEAGFAQLGGHAGFLDSSSMQIAHGESAKDTAIILSRFGHAIACRYCNWGYGNKYLNEMAKWSTKPIMNLQCDLYHPFQALADLMTMQEKLDSLKRVKVSIIWAYAESHKKPISVPVSQLLAFPRYGMDVWLAHPKGWELPARSCSGASPSRGIGHRRGRSVWRSVSVSQAVSSPRCVGTGCHGCHLGGARRPSSRSCSVWPGSA